MAQYYGPFSTSYTPRSGILDQNMPIFELSLDFDLNYTPVKFCECILHGFD